MSKIIGVTVGTPLSPKMIKDKLHPISSVNSKEPDENGNVELTAADVGAVETEQLPEAIDDALAKAKASGEFDGLPGQPGKDGAPGAPGKTAYQYAQDGGYTGTEEEFAAKLAEEVYSKGETDAAISEATNENEYELIESITVSEALDSFKRTEEQDGTRYNFGHMLLKIQCPAGTGNGTYNISFSSLCVVTISNMVSTAARTSYCFCEKTRGILKGMAQVTGSIYSSANIQGSSFNGTGVKLSRNIDSISINRSGDSSGQIPIGTKIEIWGVRA